MMFSKFATSKTVNGLNKIKKSDFLNCCTVTYQETHFLFLWAMCIRVWLQQGAVWEKRVIWCPIQSQLMY